MQKLELITGIGVDNAKRVQITFTQHYDGNGPLTVELANHELQEAVMVYLGSFKSHYTEEGVLMTEMNLVQH